MLHMREHLNSHLDSSLGLECQLGTRDALRIAAYAATGFFVMTTNTILLGLIKQITLLAPESAPLLPDGLSEEALKAERLSALEGVTARFQVLAILDPQIRVKASEALRVILGTILGISAPSSTEGAALLLVLDEGLQDGV